jgi:hypothetical protein
MDFHKVWTDEGSTQHFISQDERKTSCGKDIPEVRKTTTTSKDGRTHHVVIHDTIRIGGKRKCPACQNFGPTTFTIKVKND